MLGYGSQEELLEKTCIGLFTTAIRQNAVSRGGVQDFRRDQRGRGVPLRRRGVLESRRHGFKRGVQLHPQIKNGKVVGSVVTFMDITQRKKREEDIRYLSCHDQLTGLYNDGAWRKRAGRWISRKNLPLSVIFGDITVLNDQRYFRARCRRRAYHKVAEILRASCGKTTSCARGRDEFIALLPRTDEKSAGDTGADKASFRKPASLR